MEKKFELSEKVRKELEQSIEEAKKTLEGKEKEIQDLKDGLRQAKEVAVHEYHDSDALLSELGDSFLQGFDDTLCKVKMAYPDLDISNIKVEDQAQTSVIFVASDETDDLFNEVDDLGNGESAPTWLVIESANQPILKAATQSVTEAAIQSVTKMEKKFELSEKVRKELEQSTEEAKKTLEGKEKEIQDLKVGLRQAKEVAVREYHDSNALLSELEDSFLQGFNDALRQVKMAYPDLDISNIKVEDEAQTSVMSVTLDDIDDLFNEVDDLGDGESAPARPVTESANQPILKVATQSVTEAAIQSVTETKQLENISAKK